MKIVEMAILSTDLAMYFKKRSKFMEVVENGEFNFQSDEKKERKSRTIINKCLPLTISPCSIVRNDDDSL